MFGWLDSGNFPIGVDIGAQAVRLLQFRPARDGLALQAAARIDRAGLPEGGADIRALARAIRDTIVGGTFRGRRCVLAFSPSLIHSRSVRLPPMPDHDLAQAMQWEVKDRFGFDPDPGSVAFFRAGEVRRGTETREELLMFAAAPALLRAHLEAFMAAGLRVPAIDLQACALLRALTREPSPPPVDPAQPVSEAVLDIGSTGTQLIIHQAGRLVFYKYVEIGAVALDTVVAQKLGVSPAEAAQMRDRLGRAEDQAESSDIPAALAQAVGDALRPKLDELSRELDMCMRYHVITFRASRPEVLHVVGRQAQHDRMHESLAGLLGLRVETAQPLRGVTGLTEATRPDRSGEWAVASGLALYPVKKAAAEAAA